MIWFGIWDNSNDTLGIGYRKHTTGDPKIVYRTNETEIDTVFTDSCDNTVANVVYIISTGSIDDDEYNGHYIIMTTGNNADSARGISDCKGDTIFVQSNWSATNDDGDDFIIRTTRWIESDSVYSSGRLQHIKFVMGSEVTSESVNVSGYLNNMLIFQSYFDDPVKYCLIVSDSGKGTSPSGIVFDHLVAYQTVSNPTEQTLHSPADAIAGSYRDKILRRRWER
jgi:hypothetical protein